MTSASVRKSVPCLTDQDIRALETRHKPWRNFLGRGLFVFVSPTGAKSFRFNYRNAAGVAKTHTLGKFGKLTLAQAWAAFEVAQSQLAQGQCIRKAQLKRRAENSATLGAEFLLWFPVFAQRVGAAYGARTHSILTSDDLRPLMREKLNALDMPAVLKFCRGLEITRSPSFAREVAHALEKLYEYARAEGHYRGENPAHRVVEKLTPRDSQHWEALQLDQLPLYFADVSSMRAVRQGERATQLALQMLPYLTVRPSILRTARWDWIQWEGPHGATMIVPAFTEGTKQRTTEKRADMRGKAYAPYRVPLASTVVKLLRELQSVTGQTPLLFPGFMGRGHTECHPISEGTWLQRLRALGWDGTTAERGAITVHGFRALFATTAYTRYIVTRAEEHALEFQQDHKLTEGVRAHYTRDKDGSHRGLLLAERARLMQWWADEIDAVLAAGNAAQLPASRVDMAAAFASAQVNRHSSQLNA